MFYENCWDCYIDDSWRKITEVDGRTWLLEYVTVYGDDEYLAIRDHMINQAEVFVFIFSVADPDSFEKMLDYFERVVRIKDEELKDIPCVIAVNRLVIATRQRANFVS